MLRQFYLIILSLLIIPLNGQDHWEKLDQSDGLLSENISHFIAETPTKWWIATNVGISLIDNGQISNYTPSGTLPGPLNIVDLELAQNKLWMATNDGLFSFDGANFQRYDTADGFSTIDISSLAADSQDNLWIGTNVSASMYDGQNFTHHDSINAPFIFVDASDRVYSFRFTSIINVANYNLVYDSSRWIDYGPQLSQFYPGNNYFEYDGEIYLLGGMNDYGYYTIDYPNPPSFSPLKKDPNYSNPRGFLKDQNLIFGSSGPLLFQTTDSVFDRLHLSVKLDIQLNYDQPLIQQMAKSSDRLFLCTDKGLIYTDLEEKRTVKSDSLDLNLVKSKVLEYGPAFSSTAASNAGGFGFPKNNPTYTAYTADFLFVGRESSTQNYRNTIVPFFTEWNAGPVNNVFGINKSFMVKIQKQEVLNHISNYNQPGYQMPQSIKEWPAIGDSILGMPSDLAPFVDVNQNGCYDPANGDYPIMKGDEAIYWIRHYPDSTLKLEYHYMLYAYDNTQIPELNQCQFLELRIVNRGQESYDSAKVGFYFDGDLGNPGDDQVGCDSVNSIAYYYNGDGFDEAFRGQPGFQTNIPAVGAKFLSDSMTQGVYFNIGGGQNGQPNVGIGWWNYMNARFLDGTPITYDYFGFNSTQQANFMFAGDPYNQTGWTARNEPPGDRRFLSSFAPFSLAPGQSKVMEMVMGYGRKDSVITHYENIPEMTRVLNMAGAFWDTLSNQNGTYGQNYNCNPVGLANRKLDEAKLSVYPNPASSQLILESEVLMERVQFFSLSGGLIKDLQLNTSRVNLDVSEMNNGLYLIRIFSEEKGWISKKILIEK